jgi:proteasome lid subunit RPN8/RPN11
LDWLNQVHQHARSSYPEECCGAIMRSRTGGLRAQPLTNIQNHLHAADAFQHPRDARRAYTVDPAELLSLRLERGDEELAAIYHSHNDADAELSEVDRRQAAPGGRPWMSAVGQLVVSVREGQVEDTRLYAWQAASGDFEPVGLDSLASWPQPCGASAWEPPTRKDTPS